MWPISSTLLMRNLKYFYAITRQSMATKRVKLNNKENLVWVDLEMSGLNVEKDHILEFACLVTDQELNIIAEGPNVVIKQPDEVLDNMDDWCTKHHGESGLTQNVRDSTISLAEAEGMALAFVREHTPAGKCPLAGNTVHVDKQFLAKYMPKFMEHLHYRIVDVSTVKELCRRWYRREFDDSPPKALSHRALDDIRESVEELRYYRQAIFKEKPPKTIRVHGGDSNNTQESDK